MRRTTFPLLAATAALAIVPALAVAQDAQSGHGQPEPPMLGVHWARGQAPAAKPGGGGSSPLLLFHGGSILTGVVVESVFWGTSWPAYVGDKMTGIDTFYGGIGGSHYDNTNTEYTGNNGIVGTGIVYTGGWVDPSAAPTRAPKTSAILNEVCKVLASPGSAGPVANGYYPVYTDLPRGHAGYCAWHSWGSCNGVPIQFAFFFDLDNDAGCDPQDATTGHSQGLAALANVSGHELSDAQTDPRGGGWYDSSGAENADKCAWQFPSPSVTFSDSTQWKVQANWSNAAYDAAGGSPVGCIDTK